MDLSEHDEQQLISRLQQIAARHGQWPPEDTTAQTSDLNEAMIIVSELDVRFHRRVAVRETPPGSGHWAVVDIQ